jgi:phospholipase C
MLQSCLPAPFWDPIRRKGICADGPSRNVSGLTTEAEYLLPYPLSYLGGEENRNKTQCLCAGANNWIPTHQAMNNGAFDMWAQIDTPQSWGYMMRDDIPFHFALAEAFTVADTYHVGDDIFSACSVHEITFGLQCGITSNTDPNRCYYQVSAALSP